MQFPYINLFSILILYNVRYSSYKSFYEESIIFHDFIVRQLSLQQFKSYNRIKKNLLEIRKKNQKFTISLFIKKEKNGIIFINVVLFFYLFFI